MTKLRSVAVPALITLPLVVIAVVMFGPGFASL